MGVLGTADDNWGVYALNDGADYPALQAENDTTAAGSQVFYAFMPLLLNGDANIGDAGCSKDYRGLQIGQTLAMSNCQNYTLLGDDFAGNTFLNAGDANNDPAFISLRVYNSEGLRANNDTSVTIGTLDVTNSLTKPFGSFKIDHPLDPANKYLYHSFVESPDMKNIYDGVAALDENGEAVVTLPDWFEALNRDFRYQLTSIGAFASVYIAEEIQNNRFKIAGGKPGIKVSWQITGIRQDAFANAHRIQVEVEKAPADHGHYLHPELFGAPETARIGYLPPVPWEAKPQHNGKEMQRHHGVIPRLGANAATPRPAVPSIAPPIMLPPVRTTPPAAGPSVRPHAVGTTVAPAQK